MIALRQRSFAMAAAAIPQPPRLHDASQEYVREANKRKAEIAAKANSLRAKMELLISKCMDNNHLDPLHGAIDELLGGMGHAPNRMLPPPQAEPPPGEEYPFLNSAFVQQGQPRVVGTFDAPEISYDQDPLSDAETQPMPAEVAADAAPEPAAAAADAAADAGAAADVPVQQAPEPTIPPLPPVPAKRQRKQAKAAVPPPVRAPRLCSHCRKTGHYQKTCPVLIEAAVAAASTAATAALAPADAGDHAGPKPAASAPLATGAAPIPAAGAAAGPRHAFVAPAIPLGLLAAAINPSLLASLQLASMLSQHIASPAAMKRKLS